MHSIARGLAFVTLILGLAPPSLRAAPGQPPPGLQAYPVLFALPDTVIGLWVDAADPSGSRIHWSRWTQPLPDTLSVRLASGSGSQTRGVIAASTGWGLAVWEHWFAGVASVCASSFIPSAPPEVLPATSLTGGVTSGSRPAVAVRDSVALVVWEDERVAPGDIYAARWDRDLGLRDPLGVPLAEGTADQRWPRVAAGETGFLVAWSEVDGAVYRIKVQAFDSQGIPAASARFVSSGAADATWPDLCAWSNGYAVSWATSGVGGGAVEGVRVTAVGDLVPTSFTVDGAYLDYFPRLAQSSSGIVLAWIEASPLGRTLRRTRIDASGLAHPPFGVTLTQPAEYASDLSLAASGDIAWAAWRVPLPEDEDDLIMARFPAADSTGQMLTFPMTQHGFTAVGVEEREFPHALQAQPNPFRGQVRLYLSEPGRIVDIFDVSGRCVQSLQPVGENAHWDGRSSRGEALPPGVYWARTRPRGWVLRLVMLP